MAKFIVTFRGPTDARGMPPEPEEVSADQMIDHPPFVDFMARVPGEQSAFVARYRQDDVLKVTRED